MPADRLRLRLLKSNNQEVPDMLPLSEGLCRESEIIVFEPRPEPGKKSTIVLRHEKTNLSCAQRQDFDQPGHTLSEIEASLCASRITKIYASPMRRAKALIRLGYFLD